VQSGSLHALTAEPAAPRCRPGEVNLCFVARRLGIIDQAPRTIIAKVRLLAANCGFPLPKTPRFVKGARLTGPDSIHAGSIWDRDPVECWFEDDRPPPEAAAAALVRRNAAAEEMARRAHGLVLVSNNG
jgi:hypothetical protein